MIDVATSATTTPTVTEMPAVSVMIFNTSIHVTIASLKKRICDDKAHYENAWNKQARSTFAEFVNEVIPFISSHCQPTSPTLLNALAPISGSTRSGIGASAF